MKAFEPFRLDLGNECLWRVGERIPLTPKAFSLLAYLVERAGTLVTQNELMGKLWPDTFVQPEVLKTHIRDLRSALGDDARAPRFIETQHRRGYRFIAPVSELSSNTEKPLPAHSPSLVGQESNLKALGAIFQDASAGKPQLVFLTGEVGIGKTSLVNSFERQIVFTESHARVVRGQCVEGFAVHEAYYPVLEAISNLLRLPGCELVVAALARYAPTWLAQFPNQIEKLKSESLYRDVAGATRERMLRELNEGMKVIARDSALVVILEDVHWADSYTIDWLSAMARGGGAAKLMVVATLRPVGLALTQSPLKAIKHRLLTHKLCREIAVEPLAESAVDQYLRGKTQDGQVPPGLAQMIYAHSEGNPFFMGAILEHLLAQGMLSLDGGIWTIKVNLGQSTQIVPETLRQMIETHVGFMLSEEERRVLEAASVCGVTYTAAFVDTAAEKCQEEVEEICERLSSYGHFIRTVGTSDFPNGISSSQFEFVHSLYREIFYRRIPPAASDFTSKSLCVWKPCIPASARRFLQGWHSTSRKGWTG